MLTKRNGGGKPSPQRLNKLALNRALLARQFLLDRSNETVPGALTRLSGMQAQTPNAPYIALWSRLKDFDPKLLTGLIRERRVVRIALMRGTIHLVNSSDCLELRPHFAAVLERGMRGAFGRDLKGLDLKKVAAAARKLLGKESLTFAELGKRLQQKWPGRNPDALANVARAMIPLVQIPPRGIWGECGPAIHAPAETWLGMRLCPRPDVGRMIHRYLAAFGPATVRDAQAWSGLAGLRAVLEAIRPNLITFRDEEGNELFDLPDAPRPDPDTPAPPRFLPVFDNVLLSHADRRRILAEEHRKVLFGSAALLEGTVLVGGFVGARWKIVQENEQAALTIQPFGAMRRNERTAIVEEGGKLLRFALPDAQGHEVRFAG